MYMEPVAGRRLFLDKESGVLTELKPPGWQRFASAASELKPDTGAPALAAVAAPTCAWERTLGAVARAPLVAALVQAAGRRAWRKWLTPAGRGLLWCVCGGS